MLDSKSIVQFMLNLIEQRIIELSVWFYQMCSKRSFRCAHRPDMQIVNFGNSRQLLEITLHLFRFDIFRNGLKGKVDRFAQQFAGAWE